MTLGIRKLVILLFHFFPPFSCFFNPSWEWKKKAQRRRDLAKHRSILFLLHQSKKTVSLTQHRLKPKTKVKVCRRGVEKKKKKRGEIQKQSGKQPFILGLPFPSCRGERGQLGPRRKGWVGSGRGMWGPSRRMSQHPRAGNEPVP